MALTKAWDQVGSRLFEESNIKSASQLRDETHMCSTHNTEFLHKLLCPMSYTHLYICRFQRDRLSLCPLYQSAYLCYLPVTEWGPAKHIMWTSCMLSLNFSLSIPVTTCIKHSNVFLLTKPNCCCTGEASLGKVNTWVCSSENSMFLAYSSDLPFQCHRSQKVSAYIPSCGCVCQDPDPIPII